MRKSITIGEVTINPSKMEITTSNGAFVAQKKIFEACYLLMSNAGRVVTREELQRFVWRDMSYVDPRAMNTCIANVRKIVGSSYLTTFKMTGYMFNGDGKD